MGAKLARIESDALQTDLFLLEGVDSLSSESILLSTILKLVDQCECCYIIATCRDETAVPNGIIFSVLNFRLPNNFFFCRTYPAISSWLCYILPSADCRLSR